MPEHTDNLIATILEGNVKGSTDLAIETVQAILADAENYKNFESDYSLQLCILEWGAKIIQSRPSQITLRNAVLNALSKLGVDIINDDDEKVLEVLRSNVLEFINSAEGAKEKIATSGAHVIQNGDVILTHSYSGMVLAMIKHAVQNGKNIKVYVTETRPKYQGVRMAKELALMGIETTLTLDSAARYIMKKIDIVLIGVDTVSSDGSIITKIGSSQIALAANEAKVPFYVAAPTFKFSEDTLSGVMIALEEGNPLDLMKDLGINLEDYNELLEVYNPSYDAIPPEYIRGVITERYIMSPYSIGEYLANRSGVK